MRHLVWLFILVAGIGCQESEKMRTNSVLGAPVDKDETRDDPQKKAEPEYKPSRIELIEFNIRSCRDPEDMERLFQALIPYGDGALPTLQRFLIGKDLNRKLMAAKTLFRMQNAAPIPELLNMLSIPPSTLVHVRTTGPTPACLEAVLLLRFVSGMNFQYDPFRSPEEVHEAIGAWRRWWHFNQGTFVVPHWSILELRGQEYELRAKSRG